MLADVCRLDAFHVDLGNTSFAFASAESLTDGAALRALVTGDRSAWTRSAL